ncbi:MAG: ParA family protein, partial [Faecousia sp.]
ILNLKGGVGKTTTVIHMAQLLHRDFGARVLVVDCDPQCNLTQFFGADPDNGCTPDLLVLGWYEGAAASFIQPTEADGVDILAAEDSLMELDLSQLKTDRVKKLCFRMMILELGRLDAYDYVLFDCPPAFNSACAAALIAADDVVIPIKLDAFSVTGMANVMRQVKNMQRINSRLRVAGVLPTMWYRSEQIAEAETILRQSSLPVFPHIRRNNRVDNVSFDRALANAKTGHMRDYKRFVEAYTKQGGREE